MKIFIDSEVDYWLTILNKIYDIVDTKRNSFNASFLDSVRFQLLEKKRLSDKQMLAIMNIAEGLNITI
jgi:hypothetical protein